MTNINNRLKKAEQKLNINQKNLIVTIFEFGGELPPEQKQGNITIRYAQYDEKAMQ